MKLTDMPVKEVAIVCTFVMGLTGFYYSTGNRLGILEAKAEDIDKNVEQMRVLREQSITLTAQLDRIDEKLDEVKQKIDNVEAALLKKANR